MQGYRKLHLYQKAKLLVIEVYKLTAGFPDIERFILIPQIRRAVLSIVANIVEGYSKESPAEYSRFLTISIGSLAELELYMDISLDLGYINKDKLDKINVLLIEVKRLLYGSRKKVRERLK